MRTLVTTIMVMLAAWLAPGGNAQAQTTVRVVETWPQGDDVTLQRNQSFYLRLEYTTDKPVQIWARPYYRGKPADAGSNPSQTYAVGSGEALGWFFFQQPGVQVDEVRISAGDGGTRSTPVVATWRGHVTGGNADSTDVAPGWVLRMQADAKAAQDRAYQAAMSKPVSAGDQILVSGFMLGIFALGMFALVAPAWGVWRWRGGWRIAAAIPAAWMAFVVLRILVGATLDPTSHNLWPFEILQAGALSAVAMLALWIARRLSGAGKA